MTPRLKAVCGLIRPCDLLADIGCDHGYVARYALENGVKTVIAADVAPASLEKARKLLRPYGDRAVTVCTNGLAAIDGYEPDVIVIAGMGGKNMIEILTGYARSAALILGPQRDEREVRLYLTRNGWKITDDFVVCDRNRYYDVLRAERGEQRLDEKQLRFGVFYREKNTILEQKLTRQKARLEGYGADTADITEALSWQQR